MKHDHVFLVVWSAKLQPWTGMAIYSHTPMMMVGHARCIFILHMHMLQKWDTGTGWMNWNWTFRGQLIFPPTRITNDICTSGLIIRLSIKKDSVFCCCCFLLQTSRYWAKVMCRLHFHNNSAGSDSRSNSLLWQEQQCVFEISFYFWAFAQREVWGRKKEEALFLRKYSCSVVLLCQNHDHIESFKIFREH